MRIGLIDVDGHNFPKREDAELVYGFCHRGGRAADVLCIVYEREDI